MKTVQISASADKDYLLGLLRPEIRAIVAENVREARRRARHTRSPHEAMLRAIQNVALASRRVDAAYNTRDEQPSIQALIAAASGLRRAFENQKKGR